MKIVSKCGQVQVALHLRDNEVTMQVEKMPEWIRGKYPTGKPCCCRAAFGLYSLVRPELRAYGVYLWGDVVDADSRVASCFFDTVKSAAHYCQQVQDLIESFDSTGLLKKPDAGNSKEWLIASVYDSHVDRNVFNLYRFEYERWAVIAPAMYEGDARALAAALKIEVED